MEKRRKLEKKDKIRYIITGTILALFIALVLFVIIYFFPEIKTLLSNDEEAKHKIIEALSKYGSYAWVILLLAMILQIVVAILPNGIFSVVAGMMYGPWIGILLSLVGVTIGSYIVILLVRAFGKGFAGLFVNIEEKGKKFTILQDENRCLVIMFGYLLLPFLPDDFLAFIVPFTKVRTSRFLIVNFIARIPSTCISVMFGDSLINGDFKLTLFLTIIVFVIGLLCMIFNKQILKLFERKHEKENND